MGLGKTLSVIAFLHTALARARNSEGLCYAHYRSGRAPGARGGPDGPRRPRALVLVPKSVGSQWMSELRHWVSASAEVEPLHCLMIDSGKGALAQLRRWRSEGGVVVMSHNLFMSLVKPPSTAQAQRRNAAAAATAAAAAAASAAAAAAPTGPAAAGGAAEASRVDPELEEILLYPGPDLLVLDEAHVIKNDQSQMAKALDRVATRRCVLPTNLNPNLILTLTFTLTLILTLTLTPNPHPSP